MPSLPGYLERGNEIKDVSFNRWYERPRKIKIYSGNVEDTTAKQFLKGNKKIENRYRIRKEQMNY